MKSAVAAEVVAAPSIPLHSPGTATPSQALSEKSDGELSRESTASPQPLPTPVADLSHPPHPSLEREETPEIVTNQRSASPPASVQEELSPVAQSYNYTPFSDSITTGLHLAPSASSVDKVDSSVHEETVIQVKVDVGDMRGELFSPTTASVPEEHDTSRSTLIEEEEEEREEEREPGVGEDEDRQKEPVVAASIEVEREKEVLDHEAEPVAEDLSVKSDSISEHVSDLSSEEGGGGEQEGEDVDVEQVTQPSANVEPQVEEGTPLPGDQYTDSFEEPSSSTPASSPSSEHPPVVPPTEGHKTAAATAVAVSSQAPLLDELMTP